ncbi:MAG TPA: HAMP domain-containing sensor histidine kinase [Acidimicrobiia bacterium]|nr:HAMP domain-containing sensor histidine kinase [Acidimicrobiia bacterium]
MSVRGRITVVAVVSMAAVTLLVALITFLAEAQDLRGQVDLELRERAAALAAELLESGEIDALLPGLGGSFAYAQVVTETGEIVELAPNPPPLPVTDAVLQVAAGTGDRFYSFADVDGIHFRILTVPLRSGTALQVARPVDEIDLHLLHLAGILGLASLTGIGLAGALAHLTARSGLRPVEELIDAADRVARTRDLAERIEVKGDRELARLAVAFNAMVAALEEATEAQNQLVVDASHELFTPLTVLRTDLDLLARLLPDDDPERGRPIARMRSEIDHLIELTTDLIDLTRVVSHPGDRVPVMMDEVVSDLLLAARAAYPDIAFHAKLQPTVVQAQPEQARALARHLVENAATWSAPGTAVEVELSGGKLSVRDHGPGIDAVDLPQVFRRFYRSPAARALPGSGLGLAIVEKAAREHGWNLHLANAPSGGTIVEVDFWSTHHSAQLPDLTEITG